MELEIKKKEADAVITAIVCWALIFVIAVYIMTFSSENDLFFGLLTLVFYMWIVILLFFAVRLFEHKSGKELTYSLGFQKLTVYQAQLSVRWGCIALLLLIFLILIEDLLRTLILIPQLETKIYNDPLPFLFNILSQLLVVGLIEESFFRGYLLQRMERISDKKRAIILSSLLFGIYHFPENIMISPVNGLIAIIYTFLAGVLLGILFLKTESIYAPIIVHGLHNILWDYIILTLRCIY